MLVSHILPILLLNYYHDGYAFPLDSTSSNETSPSGVGLASLDAIHTEPHLRRTLLEVVWGCVITVVICAWTSVHPNVPPSRGSGPLGKMSNFLRRVKLTFWAIVAPELMVLWAVHQWLAAREIRDIHNNSFRGSYKSKRWTTAHGHFVTMGAVQLVAEEIRDIEEPQELRQQGLEAHGHPVSTMVRDVQFEIREPPELRPQVVRANLEHYMERYIAYQQKLDQCKLGPLTPKRLKRLVEDHKFEIPTITVAEIRDRSKGDGLSKLIVILQTLWFITQCIARGVQRLALTQLELVTLATVGLNLIASAFWWRKPLGVEEPVNAFVPANAWENSTGCEEHGHDSVEGDKVDVTARHVINGTSDKVTLAMKFIFDPLRYRGPPEKPVRSLASSLGLYAIRLPYRLFFVLTYPIFLAFTFATLFLLWAIKPRNHGLQRTQGETVVIRLLLDFRGLPYKLSHSIRKYFGSDDGPLGKVSFPESYRSYQDPSFVFNWFFVVPVGFFFLLLLLIVLSPLFVTSLFASSVLTVAFNIDPPNIAWHRATHIPTFYAPHIERHRYSRTLTFAFCCAIFGGIQCLAWNISSPTTFSWLLTALSLCFVPFITVPLAYPMSSESDHHGLPHKVVKDLYNILISSFYIVAKLYLTVQALILLRRQPATAFYAVDWTKYIPHLNYH